MLLHYYTQSLFFYLSLSSNRDLNRILQTLEYDYLPQEVCVAQCLQSRKAYRASSTLLDVENDQSLKLCLDNCSSKNDTLITATKRHNPRPKEVHENYILKLVCRDEASLNFKIDLITSNKINKMMQRLNQSMELTTTTTQSSSALNIVASENLDTGLGVDKFETLFVIKLNLAYNADDIRAFLSDDNFFKLDSLQANTTYNISVLAVHANNTYSVIAQQQQFKTLPRSYTPGNVKEIKITHFTEDKLNTKHISASVVWKPAGDMTCDYDIIYFSPEGNDYDLLPLEISDPRQLYQYQLENLTFSTLYKVGIMGTNRRYMRESEMIWFTFSAPSCVEWYNYNFNICAPEAPQNLHVAEIVLNNHVYSLNISWLLPSHLPENYTLRVQDLSEDGILTTYELPNDIQNFFIPQINFYGMFYEVSLTAYTRGGHVTTSVTDIAQTVVHLPDKSPLVKLIALILAPIFCVAILSLTIFIIYHRRAKLKRYQKRCKYFEELEKKAPIDPKNNFDFTTKWHQNNTDYEPALEAQQQLIFDDDMEIDRNDLILYQVLGEGAFGLVKLGHYKDNKLGTSQEVAVKMLKDHPTADDIYAFRREIEVMKSVEKHPNIVGIIGHCTRFSNEMMLVTEYCSLGNLLNFLRDEWHFLHELQIKKELLHANIAYIELNQPDSSTSSQESSPQLPKHYNSYQLNDSIDPHKQSKWQFKHHGTATTLEDHAKANKTDDNAAVIEHFRLKYKQIDMKKTPLATNRMENYTNSESKKINGVGLEHVQDLNTTEQEEDEEESKTNALLTATENKSYGYHGFCTSYCKCNVEVIVKNINSHDALSQEAEAEQLHQVLSQQQETSINSTCRGDTMTVQIKNCDCKSKKQYQSDKQVKGDVAPVGMMDSVFAIDNKSYFSVLSTAEARKHNRQVGKLIDTGNSKRIPLSCGDLLNIARQVAVGMEFLATNKVVHRDLAARNVLVAPDRTVKIADFGLSRDVYQENMYKKTGNGKLPIKWLALESMTHQVYTTQSDVWSYGILLYEIVTLGATPYPSISTSRLLHLLKSGYRMEKPKGCAQEFYELMYSCWNAEPIARPTFNDIMQKLDDMLNSLEGTKDTPTIYSQVDEDLATKRKSIQNISSDESYLNPL